MITTGDLDSILKLDPNHKDKVKPITLHTLEDVRLFGPFLSGSWSWSWHGEDSGAPTSLHSENKEEMRAYFRLLYENQLTLQRELSIQRVALCGKEAQKSKPKRTVPFPPPQGQERILSPSASHLLSRLKTLRVPAHRPHAEAQLIRQIWQENVSLFDPGDTDHPMKDFESKEWVEEWFDPAENQSFSASSSSGAAPLALSQEEQVLFLSGNCLDRARSLPGGDFTLLVPLSVKLSHTDWAHFLTHSSKFEAGTCLRTHVLHQIDFKTIVPDSKKRAQPADTATKRHKWFYFPRAVIQRYRRSDFTHGGAFAPIRDSNDLGWCRLLLDIPLDRAPLTLFQRLRTFAARLLFLRHLNIQKVVIPLIMEGGVSSNTRSVPPMCTQYGILYGYLLAYPIFRDFFSVVAFVFPSDEEGQDDRAIDRFAYFFKQTQVCLVEPPSLDTTTTHLPPPTEESLDLLVTRMMKMHYRKYKDGQYEEDEPTRFLVAFHNRLHSWMTELAAREVVEVKIISRLLQGKIFQGQDYLVFLRRAQTFGLDKKFFIDIQKWIEFLYSCCTAVPYKQNEDKEETRRYLLEECCTSFGENRPGGSTQPGIERVVAVYKQQGYDMTRRWRQLLDFARVRQYHLKAFHTIQGIVQSNLQSGEQTSWHPAWLELRRDSNQLELLQAFSSFNQPESGAVFLSCVGTTYDNSGELGSTYETFWIHLLEGWTTVVQDGLDSDHSFYDTVVRELSFLDDLGGGEPWEDLRIPIQGLKQVLSIS